MQEVFLRLMIDDLLRNSPSIAWRSALRCVSRSRKAHVLPPRGVRTYPEAPPRSAAIRRRRMVWGAGQTVPGPRPLPQRTPTVLPLSTTQFSNVRRHPWDDVAEAGEYAAKRDRIPL